MVEDFHRFTPHSDIWGWLWIATGVILGIMGWKSRRFVAPSLAMLTGVAFNSLKLDNDFIILLLVPVIIGQGVDFSLGSAKVGRSLAVRAGWAAAYLAIGAFWAWLGQPFQFDLTLTPTQLTQRSSSPQHRYSDRVLDRADIKSARNENGEWRFTAQSNPGSIEVADYDWFRDSHGKVFNGSQVANRVITWSESANRPKA